MVDVSVPSAPDPVGNLPRAGITRDVAVAGGLAVTFVTTGANGTLGVVDVSLASSPVELGTLTVPAAWGRVAVDGTRAYLANWWGGVRLVDLSDPMTPRETGVFDPADPAMRAVDLALAANHAFVADSFGGGLRVVNVANPLWPHEVGWYRLWSATGVDVRGGLAYLATGDGGLEVVDVSDCTAELFSDGFESEDGLGWRLAVE